MKPINQEIVNAWVVLIFLWIITVIYLCIITRVTIENEKGENRNMRIGDRVTTPYGTGEITDTEKLGPKRFKVKLDSPSAEYRKLNESKNGLYFFPKEIQKKQ